MKNFFLLNLVTLLSFTVLADNLPIGQVIGWGVNISGQATGVADSNLSSTGVVSIANHFLTNAIAISAGTSHALALKADGKIVGWGNNMSGRAVGVETEYPYRTNGQVIINGAAIDDITAIAAYQYSLAAERAGSVKVWGKTSSGQPVGTPINLNDAIAVSAGLDRALVLKRDTTVIGISEAVPVGLSNVVAVASSKAQRGKNLALKSDGTVFEWHNGSDQGDIVANLSNVVSIAIGTSGFDGSYYLALKKDQTVFGWGNNGRGQATGVPSDPPYASSGLVSINGHTLSNIVAIAAGNGYSLGLKSDGAVVEWGYSFRHFTDLPAGLSNIVAIAAGENFCLAITTNNAVADRFRHK